MKTYIKKRFHKFGMKNLLELRTFNEVILNRVSNNNQTGVVTSTV